VLENEGEDDAKNSPIHAPNRCRIVKLVRSGRPIVEPAQDFEASAKAFRKWVRQAWLDEGLPRRLDHAPLSRPPRKAANPLFGTVRLIHSRRSGDLEDQTATAAAD